MEDCFELPIFQMGTIPLVICQRTLFFRSDSSSGRLIKALIEGRDRFDRHKVEAVFDFAYYS